MGLIGRKKKLPATPSDLKSRLQPLQLKKRLGEGKDLTTFAVGTGRGVKGWGHPDAGGEKGKFFNNSGTHQGKCLKVCPSKADKKSRPKTPTERSKKKSEGALRERKPTFPAAWDMVKN